MTKMRKGRVASLLGVAVLCALAVALALGVFAARVGSFEDAEKKLAAIEGASEVADMKEAILDLRAYLDRNPLDSSDERYEPLMKRYGYQQYRYVSEVMALFDTALGATSPDADLMKTYYNDICTVMRDPGLVIALALVDEGAVEGESILRADYDEFSEKLEKAPVLCVSAMLDSVGNKKDKVAAFDSIKAFMAINKIEPETKLDEENTVQDKMYDVSLQCAKELIGKVAASNIKTFENGKALRALAAFIENNPLRPNEDEDSDYALFMKELQQKTAAHEKQLLDNRDKLSSRATFDDYVGGVIVFKNDFNAAGGDEFLGIGGAASDGVYTVSYSGSTVDKYVKAQTVTDFSLGVVIEFDYTSFTDLPNSTVNVGCDVITAAGGTKTTAITFFKINGSSLTFGGATFADVITPGQWTHFTMVCSTDNICKLYVDYELLGTVDTKASGYEYDMDHVKINAKASTGSFSLDNFVMYTGSTVRDLDYYGELAEKPEELLIYLAKGLKDEKTGSAVLVAAYDKCIELIEAGLNPTSDEGREALAYVGTLTKGGVQIEANNRLRAKVTARLDLIKKMSRSPATYNDRLADFNNIKAYLAKHEGLYEESPSDEIYASITLIEKQLSDEVFADGFISDVSAFLALTDAATVRNAYAALTAKVKIIDTDADVKKLIRMPGFESFNLAYSRYHDECVSYYTDVISIVNSEIFVSVMEYVCHLASDPDWKAKYYAELDKYMLIAKETIADATLYDPYYVGFAEAYEEYLVYEAYFFEKRQIEYAAELRAMLDSCIAAPHPFEKAGILELVKSYLAEKDIDGENETIIALKAEYEELCEALTLSEAEYSQLRTESTERFVADMTRLKSAASYTEKKAIMDGALAYRHFINRDTAEAIAADEYYIEMREHLSLLEDTANSLLTEYARLKNAKTEEQKFALLVDISELLDSEIEVGISSEVARAYADILATMEKMEKNINDFNTEFGTALGASFGLALGLNSDADSIIRG